jgi:hypothetical protein
MSDSFAGTGGNKLLVQREISRCHMQLFVYGIVMLATFLIIAYLLVSICRVVIRYRQLQQGDADR